VRMDKSNICALFGVVGPLIAYISIGISIAYSPWFSWKRSALSDLGHSVNSGVASIYNLGLLLAGFLIIVYALTIFRKHAKYTSICLIASGFMLQLVATFDEVYGFLHFAVSVMFFVLIGVSSIVYAIERKSYLASSMFIINFGSWILYGMRIYHTGIAVPETISSVAVVFWIIVSAVKILSD
jgi:hypothetical membrane protein